MALVIGNQTLGRGKLFFDKFSPGTRVGTGERYLGHSVSVNVSQSIDKIDHYDTDVAAVSKDKSVRLKTDRAVALQLDDVSKENLALWTEGTESTLTQSSGSVVDEQVTAAAVQGYEYQLGALVATPAGVRGVSAVSVKAGAPGSESAKTLTTDYTVDLVRARIKIVEGGAITAGMSVLVSYTRTANSREHIVGGTVALLEGSLRFIADNAEGSDRDWYWPCVSITPDGDFALKGDEWMAMSYNGEILKKDANTAVTYIDGQAV